MNKLSLESGRAKQKQQTRIKILKTTQKLLQNSNPLTLEEIAQSANISRATIYRYFSNVDVLCSEASLDFNTQSPESIFSDIKNLPIVDQILYIQSYFNNLAIDNENAFRRYLSIYLKESNSTNKSTRGSRRTAALKLALHPYKNQIDKQDYDKLIAVATTLMGIESIVTTKDVCGLSDIKSKDSLHWGLKTILESVFKN